MPEHTSIEAIVMEMAREIVPRVNRGSEALEKNRGLACTTGNVKRRHWDPLLWGTSGWPRGGSTVRRRTTKTNAQSSMPRVPRRPSGAGYVIDEKGSNTIS